MLLTASSRGNTVGNNEETIRSVRHFASEKEAEEWMAQHPFESAHLASANVTESCVDLEEVLLVSGVSSLQAKNASGATKQPSVVKVFELERQSLKAP